MIAVVVSREDEASLKIRDALLGVADWNESEPSSEEWEREWTLDTLSESFAMVEKDGLHLYYDGVDDDLRDAFGDVSLIVFVSRHSGETGPLLTAHHTGNFGSADYGGELNSLTTPAPGATRHLVRYFDENSPEDFEPSLEATHHGPSELETPSLFAEVGSGPDEWARDDAARVVAEGVVSLLEREKPRTKVVGVGGGHYAPRFTRVALETDAGFGHIVADYGLEAVEDDRELLQEAFELSDADAVLVGGDYDSDDLPHPVVSESYLRERAGVPETTIRGVEETLGAEAGEARLTERAKEGAEGAVEFNAEIVREASNIDREATYEALEQNALGYVEEEGQVARVAVAPSGRGEFVESLAELLRGTYEVEVEDKGIAIERETFDAEKARELGVDEGPAFGRLSSGETVEVGGDTVRPEDVHSRERLFLPYAPDGDE